MGKVVDIVVLNSPSISKCEKLLEIVGKYNNAIHLICGGLGECLEYLDVVEKVLGIPNVYDDDHIIKELKRRGIFISGKWVKVGDICFIGIDSKNPMQSIGKIFNFSTSRRCSLSIILSTYPLTISRCSKTMFRGKEYLIGIPVKISREVVEAIIVQKLIISCTEHSSELCIDRINESTSYLSIPKDVSALLLRIDISGNEVASIHILE